MYLQCVAELSGLLCIVGVVVTEGGFVILRACQGASRFMELLQGCNWFSLQLHSLPLVLGSGKFDTWCY